MIHFFDGDEGTNPDMPAAAPATDAPAAEPAAMPAGDAPAAPEAPASDDQPAA